MITAEEGLLHKPERVVVLGASGVVGNTLTSLLMQHAINTFPVRSSEVNLIDPASTECLQQLLSPKDVVVFCSAITPDKGKDIRTLMKNLAMGEHVCGALPKAKCAHIVYVSSDAVYPDGETPIRETTPCNPSSFHGLMHLTRERMLQATLNPLQIPLLCLRPTALYGINDTHNGYGPNRFVRSALREGKISLFGNGEEQRDHLSIDDLAPLILKCISHRLSGTLNAATGQSISFYELARKVASLNGPNVKIECTSRSGPVTHRHFDTAAAIKAFPELQFRSIESGLFEMHQEILKKDAA